MTIEFYWRLPASGDGRSIHRDQWTRGDYTPERSDAINSDRKKFARTDVRRDGYTWYDHLTQISRAAELTGFDGVLIPQTAAGEEPWIVAGALAREVRQIKFLPVFPAHFLSAVYAAKMAISFQRLTGGRLAWHLIAEEHGENVWHGHRWSVAEQIARTNEFLDVAKGFWQQPPFTYHGQYYEVENGGFSPALKGPEFPLVYLSGESPEALALSAKHADVHFLPLDGLAETRARIEHLDQLALAHGRKLRYAIEADVIARHTGDEAWRDLRRRWAQANNKTVALDAAHRTLDSHIQNTEIDNGFDDLIVGSNLWSGFGLVRPGAPVGFVGSFDQIAERIAEYRAVGIDTFVFGANPHLEEAYRIGEQLLPRVRRLKVGDAI